MEEWNLSHTAGRMQKGTISLDQKMLISVKLSIDLPYDSDCALSYGWTKVNETYVYINNYNKLFIPA